MKMKSIQYWGPGDIRYEEVSIKPLEEGEVLVKVESALTCGTDVKTFRRGHPVLIKQIPSGFGHEFAGTVAKLGKNVDGLQLETGLLLRIQHLAVNVFTVSEKNLICAKTCIC